MSLPMPRCMPSPRPRRSSRVVYGASDDKRGYHTYCDSPFHKKTEVVGGVLAEECAKLMTDFFKKKR